MPERTTPEWEVILYPSTRIPGRRIEAFAVADLLADIVSGKPSTWGGIITRDANGPEWSDWGRLGPDLSIQNAGFARFLDSGIVEFGTTSGTTPVSKGSGGFFALPSRIPLAVAGSGLGSVATRAADYASRSMAWSSVSGSHEAVPSLTSNGTSGIRNIGDPNEPGIAQTTTPWGVGKGMHLDFAFTGNSRRGDQGYLYHQVSENLRIAMRQNQPFALERRGFAQSGMIKTPSWQLWTTFQDADVFDARRRYYSMALYEVANRLVWHVGDKAQWVIDSTIDASQGETPPGAAPLDFVPVARMSRLLGGTPLRIETGNLRARVEVASREQVDDSGAASPGTISRTVTRNSLSGAMLQPSGVGFLPEGTDFSVEVAHSGHDVTYTATLMPSADKTSTPFLSQVYLSYAPTWQSTSGTGIPIGAYVNRGTVSHAHPPTQAGCDGSVTLDLARLQNDLPEAESYIRDGNPVEITGRWRDESGSPLGVMRPLMTGFINGISASQSTPSGAEVTLILSGPMMRLRDPYAKITGNALPLDYYYKNQVDDADLAAQKAAEDNFVKVRDENGRIVNLAPYKLDGYYGCDGAYDLVRNEMGPNFAANFNGNGNARRFLPAHQPPFLNHKDIVGSWIGLSAATGESLSSGSMQSQTGSFLNPPFGEDVFSWIGHLASDEYCIFTELFAARTNAGYPTEFQCLAYGGRQNILSMARKHILSGSDVTRDLMESMSFETHPENHINEIVVWSNPKGQQIPGLPAFVQGEARLPPSHPLSAEKTGRRVKVIETSLCATALQARVLALIALYESQATTGAFPRHVLGRGDAKYMTGDVFPIQDAGDLGMDGAIFRAARVEHVYERKTDLSWKTTLTLQPMSADEIAVAQSRSWWNF